MALKIFWILTLAVLLPPDLYAYTWQKMDQGLFYAKLEEVHAFKIDPKRYKLSIVTGADFGETATTAEHLAQLSKALLVVNGGFFNSEKKSLGLLVRDGKIMNKKHPTSWWAVFQIRNKRPSILPPGNFKPNHDVEMALQVGPRLVIKNSIPKLKFSVARRSGIGIQPGGELIIAVSEIRELPMNDFANLFKKSEKEGGLGCSNALNLDGGGSSQLYADWGEFKVNIRGISRIPNGIGVFPRH